MTNFLEFYPEYMSVSAHVTRTPPGHRFLVILHLYKERRPLQADERQKIR